MRELGRARRTRRGAGGQEAGRGRTGLFLGRGRQCLVTGGRLWRKGGPAVAGVAATAKALSRPSQTRRVIGLIMRLKCDNREQWFLGWPSAGAKRSCPSLERLDGSGGWTLPRRASNVWLAARWVVGGEAGRLQEGCAPRLGAVRHGSEAAAPLLICVKDRSARFLSLDGDWLFALGQCECSAIGQGGWPGLGLPVFHRASSFPHQLMVRWLGRCS